MKPAYEVFAYWWKPYMSSMDAYPGRGDPNGEYVRYYHYMVGPAMRHRRRIIEMELSRWSSKRGEGET